MCGLFYCCQMEGYTMPKKKTHVEFIQEVHEEYEVLGKYINARTNLKVKHKKCGYTWEAMPDNLIRGIKRGLAVCPVCNSKLKLSTDDFKVRVKELTGDEYEILGEYVNNQTHIKMRHNKCNHVYHVSPNHFLNGKRCPKCKFEKQGNRLRKSHQQFIKEVYNLVRDEYQILSNYINNKEKVKILHNICGSIYKVSPDKFLIGTRCPICKNTKGEKVIMTYLTEKNIKNTQQFSFADCKFEKILRFDFAIFDDNNNLSYLIEYDGIQHFEPTDFANKGEDWAIAQFEITKKRDQIKNQYCKENNISLIRIPYWKFDEIESILNKLIKDDHVEVDENFIVI
jgi:predicted Zn-ribbon and HTH transcriptional regulator